MAGLSDDMPVFNGTVTYPFCDSHCRRRMRQRYTSTTVQQKKNATYEIRNQGPPSHLCQVNMPLLHQTMSGIWISDMAIYIDPSLSPGTTTGVPHFGLNLYG